MFPIALDLTRTKVLLIGDGELLTRRLQYLQEAGATQVTVIDRSPSEREIASHAVIMVAGLPRAQAQSITDTARNAGKLVNVEDINDLCDFYFTANLRRGDLIIAVSTSGASPTLARKIRDELAVKFGMEWAERVAELKQLRLRWKADGKSMKEVLEDTETHLKNKGWLSNKEAA